MKLPGELGDALEMRSIQAMKERDATQEPQLRIACHAPRFGAAHIGSIVGARCVRKTPL